MPGQIELNGVRTWYDERGSGAPLVLFHPGGIGVDSRAFEPNLGALASRFHVFLPERRGHGRTADVAGPYSYEVLAEDMITFLEQVVGGPAHLLGVSDGAVIALTVALKQPALVKRLVCVAGVFHHAGWVPGVIDAGHAPPDFLVARHGELSPDGKDHYQVIQAKLDQMHTQGPTLNQEDLATVRCRTLVMVGDDDEVTLEHAIDFYRALPDGELAVIPRASHGLLVEKPDLCNRVLLDFLTLAPTPTLAPLRRRSGACSAPVHPRDALSA